MSDVAKELERQILGPRTVILQCGCVYWFTCMWEVRYLDKPKHRCAWHYAFVFSGVVPEGAGDE